MTCTLYECMTYIIIYVICMKCNDMYTYHNLMWEYGTYRKLAGTRMRLSSNSKTEWMRSRCVGCNHFLIV